MNFDNSVPSASDFDLTANINCGRAPGVTVGPSAQVPMIAGAEATIVLIRSIEFSTTLSPLVPKSVNKRL